MRELAYFLSLPSTSMTSLFIPLLPSLVWFAQQPPPEDIMISLPAGSPWWLAIVVPVVGAGLEIMRRSFNARIERQKLTFEADLALQKTELEARIESSRAGQEQDRMQAQNLTDLTSAIETQTGTVSAALTALINNNIQASEERKAFRDRISEHGEHVAGNTERLNTLTAEINGLKELTAQLEAATTNVIEVLGEPESDLTTLVKTILTELGSVKAVVTNAVNTLVVAQQQQKQQEQAELSEESLSESHFDSLVAPPGEPTP